MVYVEGALICYMVSWHLILMLYYSKTQSNGHADPSLISPTIKNKLTAMSLHLNYKKNDHTCRVF